VAHARAEQYSAARMGECRMRARELAWIACAVLGLLVSGCSCGGETSTPGGDASVDAAPRMDGGGDDAGRDDAGLDDGGEDAGAHDAGPPTCTDDAECQNDVFCDGAERCAPDDPAADAQGCAPPD